MMTADAPNRMALFTYTSHAYQLSSRTGCNFSNSIKQSFYCKQPQCKSNATLIAIQWSVHTTQIICNQI